MNLPDLLSALDAAGVAKAAYAIDNDYANEAYVLTKDGSLWAVYYSERGLKTGLRLFSDQEAACDYFCERIIKDPTTRQRA